MPAPALPLHGNNVLDTVAAYSMPHQSSRSPAKAAITIIFIGLTFTQKVPMNDAAKIAIET